MSREVCCYAAYRLCAECGCQVHTSWQRPPICLQQMCLAVCKARHEPSCLVQVYCNTCITDISCRHDFCIPTVALPARHLPAGRRVPEEGPGFGFALQPVLLPCPASGLGSGLVHVLEPPCGLLASACSLGHCSPGLLASNAPAHASHASASDCMREVVMASTFFSVRAKNLLHSGAGHAALVRDDKCRLADWRRSDFL